MPYLLLFGNLIDAHTHTQARWGTQFTK